MPLRNRRRAPKSVGGGHCPVRAFIIPEAIHHPRGLSLPGPWSDAHGPHLTYRASEDNPATGHGGPATRAAQRARSVASLPTRRASPAGEATPRADDAALPRRARAMIDKPALRARPYVPYATRSFLMARRPSPITPRLHRTPLPRPDRHLLRAHRQRSRPFPPRPRRDRRRLRPCPPPRHRPQRTDAFPGLGNRSRIGSRPVRAQPARRRRDRCFARTSS